MSTGFILGLHLLSFHAEAGMETVTPGLYVRHDSGFTLGAYRNSCGQRSAYVGWTWQPIYRLDVTVGAVSGYRPGRLMPMLAPSYRVGAGVRLAVIPNPFGPWALHLSVERAF